MDVRGKKFAVIGGAGFIGSHLIDTLLLDDVREIVVYDNFSRGNTANLETSLRDPRLKIVEPAGDIRQIESLESALEGVDGVFHLAALWLLECHENPVAAFEVNTRGTFNVLDTCRSKGIKRLVFSSSASVYGDAVDEPMTEDHPLNNQNFYGATKIAGEQMCRAHHHRYGLDYVGLRYMNVYGPRQDYKGAYVSVIMKMLDAINRGDPLTIFGDGSQAYDFVSVRDCAAANVCAMKADTTDRFYNVGTGIKTTIKELAGTLIGITGSDAGIEYEPAGVTFVKNRVGCPRRAKAEIGFVSEITLGQGLRDLIDWRENHV